MKVLVGVLLAVALAAPSADAGIFGIFHRDKSRKGYDGKKLPRPIDSPIVRPKLREDHKVGKRGGRHPQQAVLVSAADSARA